MVSRPRRSSRPVRRAAQIEEASFGSVTGSAPPLVECVLDHCYQAPPEARPPEVKGCRDFREVVRSRAGSGARGALRSVRSAGASPRRIFHLEGEHRGTDDLQSEALEHPDEVDVGPPGRHQISDERVSGGRDVPRQDVHRARCKSRGRGSPLALPFLACTKEQATAEDRPEDANRGRRPNVVAGVSTRMRRIASGD